MPTDDPRISVKELVVLALIGAITMALKVAMASLPNIEPVTLLIICTTLVFGWKSLYSASIYILLEGLLYGFGIWWFSYLYIWPLLVVVTMLAKPSRSYIVLVCIAALFGLAFGALCSIPFFITGGWGAGVSYWISGIPFDLLHLIGNAVLAALLLKPLHGLFCTLTKAEKWS